MSSQRILEPTPESIEHCARHLQQGGLVGMPTETVYGLAADACDEDAVRMIYRAKSRPAGNPLIVHVSRPEQARRFAEGWDDRCQRLADTFWPGPLTLVAPACDALPDAVTGGGLAGGGLATRQQRASTCWYLLLPTSRTMWTAVHEAHSHHDARAGCGRGQWSGGAQPC